MQVALFNTVAKFSDAITLGSKLARMALVGSAEPQAASVREPGAQTASRPASAGAVPGPATAAQPGVASAEAPQPTAAAVRPPSSAAAKSVAAAASRDAAAPRKPADVAPSSFAVRPLAEAWLRAVLTTRSVRRRLARSSFRSSTPPSAPSLLRTRRRHPTARASWRP